MTSLNWTQDIHQDWNHENYIAVVEYYERLLEEEPEVLDYYWHLGLAYLFLGKEEQAQLTWFIILGQCSEKEYQLYEQELINVLDSEAEYQEREKNYMKSWLIRGHIREIQPENYNNLIQFICLDIMVSDNPSEQFNSWKISQLISNILPQAIKEEILIRASSLIPKFSSIDALNFIRFSLISANNTKELITSIVGAIEELFYKIEYSKYVIEVLKICLEFDPENLAIINIIYVLYLEFKAIDSSIEFAKTFVDRSRLLSEKLFGYYMLLSSELRISNWQEGLNLFLVYFDLFQDFLGQVIDSKYLFIQQSFVIVGQPLPYFQDSPQINRSLINYASKVFQDITIENNKFESSSPIHLSTDRPLKIGYIGHTLRAHPVGYLSRWLIHHQNHQNIKSYAYMFLSSSSSFGEDWFVKKMEGYYYFPKDIKPVLEKIKEDQIDILVDLDSLTFQLTCQVLSLKPAPIQVTWLGFDASGVPNVDYFIADPFVLPPDADTYYSEKIWRLPHCYLGIDGFEVGTPTLKRRDLQIPDDAVIFANYQNALKRHPSILHQQMKILKEVPNSYLLIKGTGQADVIQSLFEGIAEEEDVSQDRLRFLEPCLTEMEHRANLGIVDVMLDTYPYNGATTTLETLWMEIPLVTRVGEQFAARNSYTFMINAGITEGIAWTDEEYVKWGIRLGTDENLRKEISWKLRQSKKTSPLWNGKQFAQEMEQAYRQMWEIYVKKNT